MEKAKKPYKNSVFKVVIQECEKSKMDFILQTLPDTTCVRKGDKTRTFVHTICFGPKNIFGPKQCKPGNTIKIVVSAEIAQNQK